MRSNDDNPYYEIGLRLLFLRQTTGLTQAEFADTLQVKRARYAHWENGTSRISIDGALMIRKKYGLSLDFIYEGISDALPMTLRSAWISRPLVSASK